MKQHAIPQNILDIEFKLFSKFTVKEFAYMSLGVGTGGIFLFLFSTSSIPGELAIPLFIVFSAIGLAFGLVSINDQKMDVYFVNFFKAITSPTQRVWKNKHFDEKVAEMLPANVNTQTKGTFNRNSVPQSAKATKIIGAENMGSGNTIGIQEATSIDNQDMQKLAEISQGYGILATNPNSKIQNPNSTIQDALPAQQVLVQQVPVAQLPPVKPKFRVMLSKQNIANFVTQIPGVQQKNNNLNLFLCTKENKSISNALVMLKDQNGKVIQAMASNEFGFVLSGRELPSGTFNIEIQKTGYEFPEILFILEGGFYPPVKIISI